MLLSSKNKISSSVSENEMEPGWISINSQSNAKESL